MADATSCPAAGALHLNSCGEGLHAVSFMAMASPCELLIATADAERARHLGQAVAQEAWRIETKYSRYRNDSVVAALHAAGGNPVTLDAETVQLIEFAKHCFDLSEGLFDITSGVLRKVWTFDGSDRIPSAADVERLLPRIGFDKLDWRAPMLTVPEGMEIDFGGIGKEYAVDRAYDIVAASCREAFLLNFGGDLRANKAPGPSPWRVGIESLDADRSAALMLDLQHGALATSGDARRYLFCNNIRYGHILNPLTGWPVQDAPRSITVAASSCTEAGLLSTLAMLQGPAAEAFLQEQNVRHWVQWS